MSSRLAFDTSVYPREQQRSAWTSHIHDVLFNASIQPYQSALNVRVDGHEYDALTALNFAANGHVVHRTADFIDDSPKDAIFVSIVLEGQITYCSPIRDAVIHPGSALVYNASQPYLLSMHSDTKQLFLDIPARIAKSEFAVENLLDPYLVSVASVNRGRGLALLEDVAAAVEHSPASKSTYDGLLDLVAPIIARGQEAEGSRVLQQVKTVVKHLATDQDCDSETVATSIGYSQRHINRMLSVHSTSIAQVLSDARVARAQALLSGAELSLIEVATQSGFGSTSTLKRQLQRRGIQYGFRCEPRK